MNINELTPEQTETVNFFKDFFTPQNEEEQLLINAHTLAGYFLVEIENILISQKINQKELADKIGTSPSYLSQVFHGDRLINFKTLAKIENALGIKFKINAETKFDEFEDDEINTNISYLNLVDMSESTVLAS